MKRSKKMQPTPISASKEKKNSSRFISRRSFSKMQLTVFALAFGLVGGFLIWKTFAATPLLLARPALLPESQGQIKTATPSTFSSVLSGANPGDKIMLSAGDYTQFVELSRSGTSTAPITVSGATSGVNFKGRIKVTGDFVRVTDMNIIGRTCPETQDVMIYVSGASYVDLLRLNVRDTNHSAIYVGDPGARSDHINLAYSTFRNIGCKDNLDHPAYWGSVTNGWIAYNLFLGGKGYGVHLYPDADSILVEHNTSTGHDKSGYIVAGSGSFSENNEFRDNIAIGNGHWAYRAYANGSSPTKVTNNLSWNNGLKTPAGYPAGDPVYNYPTVALFGGDVAGGLEYYGNISADPRLDTSYKPLAGSPAIGAATDGTDIGAIQTGTTPTPTPAPTPSPTPPPAPEMTVSANPASIVNGSASTLTWTSINASSCDASGGWTGSKQTSGSVSVQPLSTTVYTLTCSGSGGSVSKTVTVTVSTATPAPMPTLSLSANPSTITSGATTKLTWTSGNANTCVASGAWSGNKPASGNETLSPSSTSTYTLTCTNSSGSIAKSATVTVNAPNPPNPPVPNPGPSVSGDGLSATYFDNSNFTGSSISRIDKTIDFGWGRRWNCTPAKGIGCDTFSARWKGRLLAPTTETYTITTQSDDGIRLWIDDKLIINNWTRHRSASDSTSINLKTGQYYAIKIEYYEDRGKAVAKLLWKSPSINQQVVPQRYLFSR